MDIRKLQRAIVDGLEDVKAQQIAVFNTEHLSAMFERVIIASGTSNRQTKALAASVRDAVKSSGMQVMSTEGEDNGEWIIVDCGAAVAHIMQPAIRDYYHLEEIWGGKSVRMKVGEVNNKLVKASEPERAPRKRAVKLTEDAATSDAAPAPKKLTRTRPRQTSSGESAARETSARKTAPRNTAPRKATAGKTSPARKTSSTRKASPARKSAARG
ncbi:MAG TPA: ribosome silencing factor [Rubrivivax sp.]|nr:ribosome silencing factor [Rubrivivax sp.]